MPQRKLITPEVKSNHLRALIKITGGEKPSTKEQADYDFFEREKAREIVDSYVERVPLADIQRWFGHGTPRKIQANQLNEMQERYGLPVAKSPVSLPDFFRALRQLLAANARNLTHKDEEKKSDLQKKKEEKVDAEIKRLHEQIKTLEMRNQKEHELLVEKAQVFRLYEITADVLRSVGEDFARTDTMTGHQAQEMLNSAWDTVEQRIVAEIGKNEGAK